MSAAAERVARCNCGALSAATTGEPVGVAMCSCAACQRRTGSAFAYVSFWHVDQVTLTGEPGLRDAKGVVQRLSPEAFLMGLERGRFDPTHADTLVLARHAMTRGIAALHVLDARIPHAVVGELFTSDGIGTLITRQVIA